MNLPGITIKGAKEHNLKNIDVFIPRNKISVITGVSGCGKSTLAFDTIYAEGQRRYIESFSVYAKNFLEQFKKPNVDSIVGLSPSISIDQSQNLFNPRSTVGTVSEVYDYFRLLFSKLGTPYCPNCQTTLSNLSIEQIINEILALPLGTKFILLSPTIEDKKGEFKSDLLIWKKMGFIKAIINSNEVDLTETHSLSKHRRHTVSLIIDRLIIKDGISERLIQSIKNALKLSHGSVDLLIGDKIKRFSLSQSCPICKFSYPSIDPRFFSFNSPRGACVKCKGLGYFYDEKNNELDSVKTICNKCFGSRFKPEILSIKINQHNIYDYSTIPIEFLFDELNKIVFSKHEQLIAKPILSQIQKKLHYMVKVGIGYLNLHRPISTLSGGEAQRLRLASQVTSSLIGVLYVLDEPSIGLHPKDHHKLLSVLNEIKNLGNTIIIVEHDEDTIKSADHIIDLGPGAGVKGGFVVAQGTVDEISANVRSVTGRYLSSKEVISIPQQRRKGKNKITLIGASGNNLKNISVDIPLNCLTCVTGVSGSGKSSLIVDTLYNSLHNIFYKTTLDCLPYKEIFGHENVDMVVDINQKPIGRTPRSNPATYMGIFPLIRNLFAALPESAIRGYKPGHFSFNIKGGRCEICQGAGQIRIEMHFMPDVFVLCEACSGKKYNKETLAVKFKGKNIFEILDMSVDDATEFFRNHKALKRKLETLKLVGLGYLTLGQSSTTLSGGEAQRIKLSKELSRTGAGHILYILDEPTTGLHFSDISKLLQLIHQLVDQGNTVIIIEHNLDIIKNADFIVDLGPEGGKTGGNIVFCGTPEQLIKYDRSHTGVYLNKILSNKSSLLKNS